MSYRDPTTVKEPVLKRLKMETDLKIVTANSNPSKEKIEIHSDLESLPNEILLKIFENIKPKIKELFSLSHVCRRMRLIAHDQSFWKNVNLLPKTHSAGLLQMIIEKGCQRMKACGQIVGTLTLVEESQLEFVSTWHTNNKILNELLKSCHYLKHLDLNSVILTHDIISGICQNGSTLTSLKLAEWSSDDTRYVPNEWIQLIIDNCCELTLLDLSNTNLKEDSIEYVSKNLTQKISKLWLTGIKSVTKCKETIKLLEDRCINLKELEQFEFRVRNGTIFGIGSHNKMDQKERNYLKKMRDFTSTFKCFE